MKKTLFILLILSTINVFSQKQIFSSPNLKEIISTQKIVAILPFTTTISYKKQPKNFSVEANRDQEIKMAKNIQSSMYTFLLRKADKYTVSFQDVDKTNILLKKAGIEDKLDEMTKDEIAKILGVDAAISGKFEQEQSKSEAGAIATAVLFGGFGGKTGSGTLTLTINNGTDGELLWRFMKTMDDNIATSTDDLVESMMRKVSRNFPYLIE
ncbi:MAG TPA: hypothetical protein VLM44_08125 [Lutibacter sp.]|nr:hypothetical protein [Lutibacter sp.]